MIIHQVDDGYTAEMPDGKLFSITPPVYTIYKELQKENSIEAIVEKLNDTYAKNGHIFSISEVQSWIQENPSLKALLKGVDENPQHILSSIDNNFWCTKKILSPARALPLLSFFSKLFLPKIQRRLTFFSIAISCFYLLGLLYVPWFSHGNSLLITNQTDHISFTIGLLGAYFLLVFLHEWGHASAAYHNGIISPAIGFGMYFVFPVLYTELTRTWILPASKRVSVNLAGIYFQLLANVLLILLATLLPNTFLRILILTNISGCLYALHPFFKNDGYWVVSDYWRIANLEKRAYNQFKQVVYAIAYKQAIISNANTKRLLVYAIGSLIFWIFLYTSAFRLIIIKIPIWLQIKELSYGRLLSESVTGLFCVIIAWSAIHRIKTFWKA